MFSSCFALCVLILCVQSVAGVKVGPLVNTNIERVISLTSNIETYSLQVTVENQGQSKEDNYVVGFPASKFASLSFVSVDYEIVALDDIETAIADTTVFVSVPFPDGSLAGGASTSFKVYFTFTQTMEPYPAKITQQEEQLVKYSDSIYVFSPYPTTQIETKVNLPRRTQVESYSPKSKNVNVNTAGNSQYLTAGSYENIAAFTHKKLYLHFVNNEAFVTMTYMHKDIEVSHWGNVAVEEHYEIRHTGATLDGGFSRFDYQQRSAPSAFHGIEGIFPRKAIDFYYRDEIGNISTSRVRHERKRVHMMMEPRFPMFGGWKTDFYIGYNNPAESFLFTDSDGRYVLEINYGCPFASAVVEDAVIRVILPEGATDIKWTTPFPIDSAEEGVMKTYLDTMGRPTLTLRKANIHDKHQQNFKVSYAFSSVGIQREPIMLITVFAVFFVIVLALMRMEFSIAATKKTKTE